MKKYLQNDYQMHTAGVENLVQKINKGLPGILIFLHMWYICQITIIYMLNDSHICTSRKNFQCKELSGDVA